MAEQAKLCRPQRNRLSAPADAVRGRIHFDIGIAQAAARKRGTHAAKHGRDARCKLARGKGLGDIIVRARLKATDSIFFLDPRRQHADRSEEHTSELQSLMPNSYAVFR